ncbi:hypothetical protein [Amycolatopsis sp. NPDC051102]|uniref:hypothetical protein n=1 Tax=Amycolatopsis sp. NPDC051102 TaxID=3155163 RepID=UPI0034399815
MTLFATALVGGGIATTPAHAESYQASGTFYYFTTLGGSQHIDNPIIGVCYPVPAVPVGPAESYANRTNAPVTLYLLSNACALGAQGPYSPGQEGSAVFLSMRFG